MITGAKKKPKGKPVGQSCSSATTVGHFGAILGNAANFGDMAVPFRRTRKSSAAKPVRSIGGSAPLVPLVVWAR